MNAYRLNWFCMYPDFLENRKITLLSKVQRYHYIELLIIKARGVLEQNFQDTRECDSIVARIMNLGKKSCANLKERLLQAELIDHHWQPLGWGHRQSYAVKWQKRNSREGDGGEMQGRQGSEQAQPKPAALTPYERVKRSRNNRRAAMVEQPAAAAQPAPVATPSADHDNDDNAHGPQNVINDNGDNVSSVINDNEKSASPAATNPEKSTTCEASLYIKEKVKVKVKVEEHVDVDVDVGGGSAVVAAAEQCTLGKATRLPSDWCLPATWGQWALSEKPHFSHEDVQHEARKFADHWHAKSGAGALKLDWRATWRNWIRSEYAKGIPKNGPRSSPQLQPLSYAERDRLNRMRALKSMGVKPSEEYEQLERRASHFEVRECIVVEMGE